MLPIHPDLITNLRLARKGHPKSFNIPFCRTAIIFALAEVCFYSGWHLQALKFFLKTLDYCHEFNFMATRDLSEESEEGQSFLEWERDEMMEEKRKTIEKMMEKCVDLIDECVARYKELGSLSL